MSDVQLYLFEVDQDRAEAKRIASQSASKLESKQLKLIDLITSLQEYINNKEDGALRASSIAYLADVLESVSQQVLSGQERRLLSDFILGRIESDLEGIGSSARALVALEALGKWHTETVQKVANVFLDHANPLKQFKLQTDRYATIQLFDLLVAKYRTPLNALHESDPQMMQDFISFFEGEKDPRNLMMIFSIFLVPMTEWDVSANAQDLFEAVFNYFPVTFKPPPDDPYGITAQDLKDRLRECIAANSSFAPHAFPELLNKLDSTSMNTKRDVLHTIQACIVGYASNTINLYAVTLWDALKFEILNTQEEDLAQESLNVLSLMGAKFAQHDGFLNVYLRPIIKECNEHLEDAPTKQSQAAGRILYAVAKAARFVADKVIKGIFPVLFSLYHSSESIAKRRGLLEVFNAVTKAFSEIEPSQDDNNVEALKEVTGEAFSAMLLALNKAPQQEVSFRLTALDGIAQLVAIRGLLSNEQIDEAVESLTNIILHEQISGHGDIRSETVRRLVAIAQHVPDAVRNTAVPAFMVEIPDAPTNESVVVPILEAFVQLSKEPQIFDTVVVRLRNKLNSARNQNAPATYQQALLLALLFAFTHGSPLLDEDSIIRSTYFTDFVDPLLSSLREASNLAQDDQTLEIVGRLCNVTLRPQGLHFQASIYNRNLFWLSPAYATVSTTPERTSTLAPFTLYYYAALRPDVVDPDDITSLLEAFASLALGESRDGPTISFILRHLALFINKFINPKTMQITLQNANIEVGALLSTGSNARSVGVTFAVVKALLIQGKTAILTKKYMEALQQLLASTRKSVARQFTGLLAPDDILTKENHCLISGLYKQKTCNQLVPSIIDAVRTASPAAKPNYLIALSGVLCWLPYAMIQSLLPSLTPSLLQTLDLGEAEDQEAKAPTLSIFESVLMHDSNVVSEHTASLITRLLNCTSGSVNTPRVRAKALQCLALVPRQLKQETVVPYRRQVIKKLMASLDDPKRDVRAEAVRCRTAWLGLDEGGDDEE